MANFSVSPQAVVFGKTTVQGPISGLYATAPTGTFVLTNNSGASVTITNYGFTNSAAGDGVTQPVGPLHNSDFVVVPTGGAFPVTVANGATQSFTVTYAPLRRGSGFGDVRSQIMTLFAGNKALSNGGQITNSSGEVVNEGEPRLLTIGVGGGVVQEAYDNARVHPIFWTGGAGAEANVQGLTPSFTIADMDTEEHYSPMLFWTAFQTGAQTSVTSPRAPAPGTTGNWVWNGTAAVYEPGSSFDYGSPRGGRGYQILVFFATTASSGVIDDTLSFDLTIAVQTSSGTVNVATFPGVSYSNSSGLFVGNQAGLDLQGLTLVAITSNLKTNGTTYNTTSAYNIGAVRTS